MWWAVAGLLFVLGSAALRAWSPRVPIDVPTKTCPRCGGGTYMGEAACPRCALDFPPADVAVERTALARARCEAEAALDAADGLGATGAAPDVIDLTPTALDVTPKR